MPRPRRPRGAHVQGGLVGPRITAPRRPPPDLALPPDLAQELDARVRTILYRWRPQTDTPEALVTDLYALVRWLLDMTPSETCRTLVVYNPGAGVARSTEGT